VKILFICTANICRSFMAERILKKKLEDSERHDIDVSSASIIDMEGMPGDPVAVKILEEEGYDGDDHQSRAATEDMLLDADRIIVMERWHVEEIIARCGEDPVREKVFLLKPYMDGCDQADDVTGYDIADPYRLSQYHYRLCFAEIYLSIEGLLGCL
jgi:protein-tyrosine phosphatase